MIRVFILLSILLSGVFAEEPADIPPNPVVPSEKQIEYQKMELIGFIHFTVNTFTDREWGTGKEDPAIFNPSELSTDQWVQVAKEAGMKQLIITAKHHDGFCLWPSKYTEHSVKNSPYKNGKGDIIGELAESCRKAGLKMGIYLSPWDMHEPKYGTDEYNGYYMNQLEELLTNYGTISELWMDGAKGKNAKDMEYDFDGYRSLIYRLQPNALIFSDAGPDIRWIGNERGIAGETNWSMINNDNIEIGKADQKLLNTGDPNGSNWLVGECDVSIRPGWFYHASQDDKVKTPQELVDLFYKSVGRNGTLLLNLPPDRRGLIHENDVASLKEFRAILDETFKTNLAKGAAVQASDVRLDHQKFSAQNIVDGNPDSYWAANDGVIQSTLTVTLPEDRLFDRIMLQEPIRFGQRIARFQVEVDINGKWQKVTEATTIGYKRLLKITPVKTDKIRVTIMEANNTPAISNFGLYKASSKEETE